MADTEDPNIATLRRCFADQCMPDNSDEAMALEALASTLAELNNVIAVQENSARHTMPLYEKARGRIEELEASLAERDRRIAALEGRRRESRQLLHRLTKYVKEDRATTPGKTRLARLTEQVVDYLARTGEPSDILRGGDSALPAPAPGELAEQHEKLWTLIRAYRNECAGDLVGVAGGIGRIVDPLFEMASRWQRLQWRPASEAPCGMLLTTYEADGERIFVIDEKHAEDDGWDERDDMALPIDALPALNGGDDNG